MQMTKILYRYEIDYKSEDGDTNIRLLELPVIRETEKMYYIKKNHWGDELRRVSKFAYSTYAFNTKEKAKSHFINRTHTHIRWYEYWTEECKKAIELIQEIDK